MINTQTLIIDCKKLISQQKNDVAHQLDHLERVVKTAHQIAQGEEANLDVVIAAAYCHDIVNYPKNSEFRALSSRHAADKAKHYFTQLGYDDDFCYAVEHAIAAHSFSANIETRSLEANIVQDADRIDALGAIGIARCIQVGTSLGRPLYQQQDPFCSTRSANDNAYTIDHFYQKLLKLPDTMKTTTGRAIALQRVEFMKLYLAQLKQEIS